MQWIFYIVMLLVLPTVSHAGGFASSDNFVVYAPTQELADTILKNAEKYRNTIAIKWLGKPLPCGEGACMISVNLSKNEDSGFTWPKDHPLKRYHQITMTSSEKNLTGPTLAHEITHAVLNTKFPSNAEDELSSWAHEGLATMQDGQKLQEIRRMRMITWAKDNTWPDLKKDLIFTDAVSSGNMGAFYTIANSFTKFLISKHPDSLDTFFAFAIKDMTTKSELDAAAKKYYGVSFDKLEAQWHAWVMEEYGIKPKTNPTPITPTPPKPQKQTPIKEKNESLETPPKSTAPATTENTIGAYIKKAGYDPELYFIRLNKTTGQITLEPRLGAGPSILLRLP